MTWQTSQSMRLIEPADAGHGANPAQPSDEHPHARDRDEEHRDDDGGRDGHAVAPHAEVHADDRERHRGVEGEHGGGEQGQCIAVDIADEGHQHHRQRRDPVAQGLQEDQFTRLAGGCGRFVGKTGRFGGIRMTGAEVSGRVGLEGTRMKQLPFLIAAVLVLRAMGEWHTIQQTGAPTAAAAPAPTATSGAATTTAAPAVARPIAADPVAGTYTVQRGDSYWEIADHHLEIVLGHQPTPREVLEETHSLMDTNVERLGNRPPTSMIYSGDVLILPSPNGYHPPVEAPPTTPAAPETSTPHPPTTSTPLPPPTAPPITTVSTPTPPTTPAAPVSAPPTSPPTTIVHTETTDAQETTTPNPWTELVIGSLFATGLAATVTRLRRRRLARRTPGHRLVSTTDAVATTETVLRAESRPDRIDALHRLLGALAGHTRLEGTRPLVRAVQLTDTGIELLWTEAQPSPAKAWTTTDGGLSLIHISEPTRPY